MTNARQEEQDQDGWPFDMPWDDEEEATAPSAVAAEPAPDQEPSTVELLQGAQRSLDDLLTYVAELEAARAAERADNERLRAKAAQTIDGLMAQLDRQRAERDAERAAREEEDAEHLAELDEHKRRLNWVEREHEKCAGVQLMLERQIGSLEDQLRACQEGRLPACVNGHENGEMVPVDGGALKVLGKQAAQTEHMRQRYQYMAAAETDDRFKPGQKATMAALVDICGAPPAPGAFTAPRKVCRAAIAQRTGQAASTISKQVPDLANIGVLKLERRSVAKDRPSDDPDGQPIRRTEEEWWVSLGPLPPKSIPKEEIQAKCTHAQAEAERKKRCPGCGHATLEATSYHCTSCGRTCATAEAQAAGERFDEQQDGSIIDLLTGEKLAPLLFSPMSNGNGHARTKARRGGRGRPHPDSGGGARHTTIVHPDRIPDGTTSGMPNTAPAVVSLRARQIRAGSAADEQTERPRPRLVMRGNRVRLRRDDARDPRRDTSLLACNRQHLLVDLDLPCALCGSRERRELHHIVHRANGGTDHRDNLQVLCWVCHRASGIGVHSVKAQRAAQKAAPRVPDMDTASPIRIPDGGQAQPPPRNPVGGHATTPPCTPTGIRMGSVPAANGQKGGGVPVHDGRQGPAPPG